MLYLSISSIGIFANEIRINASSVSNDNLAHGWLLIKFRMEKPLSQLHVLEGTTTLNIVLSVTNPICLA